MNRQLSNRRAAAWQLLAAQRGTRATWHVRAIGDSMWPLIRPAATLCVLPGCRRLAPGDVVVARQATADEGERLVAHRLIARLDAERYLLKGDNRGQCDAPVAGHHIVARVIAVEDAAGRHDLERLGWRIYGRLVAWQTEHSRRRSMTAGRLNRIRQQLLACWLRLNTKH